jgi:hypothetical protein
MQQATGATILSEDSVEQSMARLEAVAKLMDSAFVLPGTDVRIGLDAVIGFVPGIGDLISGAVASYLVWEARRLGAPKWLIARMSANVLLDTTVGAIPILGDMFDLAFRANMRNMALLRKHVEKKGYARAGGSRVIEGEAVRVG